MNAGRRRKRGEGSVFCRGRIWWIKYPVNGEFVSESSKSAKESDARKLLQKRMGEIVDGRYSGPEAEKITVRELAEDYLNDYRVNAKRSLDKAERMVSRKDEDGKPIDSYLMAFFGNWKAQAVKTDAVRKYIAQRLGAGAANGTVNRELAALKRMYSLAVKAEKLYRKPYIPMLEENNVRTGFFERAEFLAFRDAVPDYLKPVVTFAYYTGWRKKEILNLTWAQVDLAAPKKTVRLNPGTTKNRAGRLIVLNGELLETVQAQWEKRKVVTIPGQASTLLCPYVFHRHGKRIADYRKSWYSAREATGLATKTLHDFRRTAVRDMVRAGVPDKVAMSISGHKTRSVFDRYDIVSEDDLEEAARRHAEYVQNQEKAAKVAVAKRA